MACYSVARSKEGSQITKVHAVVEFHDYRISPADPEQQDEPELMGSLDVLGFFFVESLEDGARFEIVHPDEVESHETVPLQEEPYADPGGNFAMRLVRRAMRLVRRARQLMSARRPLTAEPLSGQLALKLIQEQASSYFRLVSSGKGMAYACRGPFLASPPEDEVFQLYDGGGDWEPLGVPEVPYSRNAPLSCFRSPVLPAGRHVVPILLHIPVRNMTLWNDMSDEKLSIKSPPAFLDCMLRLCNWISVEGHECGQWLSDWQVRVLEPDSYFAVLLPVRGANGVRIPRCQIFGSSAYQVHGPDRRTWVQTVGCYRTPSAFEVIVEPGVRLVGRQRYDMSDDEAPAADEPALAGTDG